MGSGEGEGDRRGERYNARGATTRRRRRRREAAAATEAASALTTTTRMAGLVNDRPYVAVNVDHEGFVESENKLFKHVAIRDREQDSPYKPTAANIAPRPRAWKSSSSNTQKPPRANTEQIEAPKA